ncbi:MAG: sulfatase-like hydrolase/transferase [Desulfomicrobium escambiense]|nr:sulfatase-like hydrolase/transferase [Desulfomicrobium escambiense]
MGYRTPNIDRLARPKGMTFTDYYAEQSCTAGRASFITGQSGLRTGLTKVGLPGATVGLQKEDPTIAELLKPLGYATGQFGKNHLGDRNEYLPTVHGFDEFYGNLYHLNAEEEPELPDYPKDPAFRAKFGPRGVMDCKASDTDDPTVDPRFGKVGKQVVQGHRPADQEADGDDRRRRRRPGRGLHPAAEQGRQAGLRLGELHPHALPHPHQAGEHRPVGALAEPVPRRHDRPRQERRHRSSRRWTTWASRTTPSSCTRTDNGPHMNSWPDGAMTPFRSEKNSNWEGAYRVPGMVRWPGKIKPGQVSNEIVAHLDWLPTLLAVAGDTQVKEKLLKGYKVGDMTYKVHLDGDNLVPYLTGQVDEEPAGIVPLHQRRPATDRPALRQLEVRVHGAAGAGNAAHLGGAVHHACGCRRSSISAPTRTSGRTSPRTPTTTGCSTTPSCWSRPRRTSASS